MRPQLFVLLATTASLLAPLAADTREAGNATPIPPATLKVAPALAQVSPLITGLKEPQGLAQDGRGGYFVAEYKGGQITRFGLDGKVLGPLATGLKSPAILQWNKGSLYASERKANRVIKVSPKGQVSQVGGAIVEPLGLTLSASGELFVVAHTTSKVYRLEGKEWKQIFEPVLAPSETKRYGYRCLAHEGDALLMSDELSGSILLITEGGRVATWAQGLDDPSGVRIAPDGAIYATDEGEGGKLVRLAADGTGTVVAKGLGRPRDMLFLDAKTVLVSDRDGTVWKVLLPSS